MTRLIETTRTINYKHFNTNGGFIIYWKMTFRLWCMVLNIFYLIKIFNPWKSIYMIPLTIIKMFIKTPWYLFIKPLGQIYSNKITWIGTYKEINGDLVESSVKKHIHHKLFRITFLKHPSSITKADWDYIRK